MKTPQLYHLKQYAFQKGYTLRKDKHNEVAWVLQEQDGTPLILFGYDFKPISWSFMEVYRDFSNRMSY